MTVFLITLHILVCLILIGVVLLQQGKGADIGAVFGGGGSNTVFGSRGAGNFFTKLTSVAAIVFMGTSLWLSVLSAQSIPESLFEEEEGSAAEEATQEEGDTFTEIEPEANPAPVDKNAKALEEAAGQGKPAPEETKP